MKTTVLKKTLFIATMAVLTITLLYHPTSVYAGDREWSTVGKILTGVIGAGIVYEIIDDDDDYSVSYYHYGPPSPYYRSYYGRRYYRHHRHHRPYYNRRHYYNRDRYYCYR